MKDSGKRKRNIQSAESFARTYVCAPADLAIEGKDPLPEKVRALGLCSHISSPYGQSPVSSN